MLDVHDLRVGNILALIGEEFIAPTQIVAIDESGLVHLEGMDSPESIENMVGVPVPPTFFIEKKSLIDKLGGMGLIVSPLGLLGSVNHAVRVEFKGATIKDCSFIHELQNMLIDLVKTDPFINLNLMG
ncbi:MAG: hypothetical protein JST58_04760 [Bacteroidetes bacterium]|nr:hypothetical protein [Bacteroidota bacterium]